MAVGCGVSSYALVCVCVCVTGFTDCVCIAYMGRGDSYLFDVSFSVTVAIRVNCEYCEVACVIYVTNTVTINPLTIEYRQGDRFSEYRCLAC